MGSSKVLNDPTSSYLLSRSYSPILHVTLGWNLSSKDLITFLTSLCSDHEIVFPRFKL